MSQAKIIIKLSPTELRWIKENAIQLYNREYNDIARAWLEAFNIMLQEHDIQLMVIGNKV